MPSGPTLCAFVDFTIFKSHIRASRYTRIRLLITFSGKSENLVYLTRTPPVFLGVHCGAGDQIRGNNVHRLTPQFCRLFPLHLFSEVENAQKSSLLNRAASKNSVYAEEKFSFASLPLTTGLVIQQT